MQPGDVFTRQCYYFLKWFDRWYDQQQQQHFESP